MQKNHFLILKNDLNTESAQLWTLVYPYAHVSLGLKAGRYVGGP